jgi:low temperature requirement A protein (LtrA)
VNWQMNLHAVRPVRLWPGDPSRSRRVSWLELFFDLIFVAAVAQVGEPLGKDYTLHGLTRYALMFLLIWWAWLGHTMYYTRFDADDAVQRFLTLLQIFAALQWPQTQRLLSTAAIPLVLGRHTRPCARCLSCNIFEPAA